MFGLWDDVVWPGEDGYGLRTSDAAVGAVDDLGDLAVVGEAMVRWGIAVVRAVTALRRGKGEYGELVCQYFTAQKCRR